MTANTSSASYCLIQDQPQVEEATEKSRRWTAVNTR
jgi:hypothetical protein